MSLLVKSEFSSLPSSELPKRCQGKLVRGNITLIPFPRNALNSSLGPYKRRRVSHVINSSCFVQTK